MKQGGGLDVRRYRDADWDAIAAIHDRARLNELRMTVGEAAFLSLEETAENEGLFDGQLWVATEDDAVVGFVAFDEEEVTWLYVAAEQSRRGVATALLSHALGRMKRPAEVSVLDGTDPAIALYEKLGFRIVETKTGRLEGNEGYPATGHRMVLNKKAVMPVEGPFGV